MTEFADSFIPHFGTSDGEAKTPHAKPSIRKTGVWSSRDAVTLEKRVYFRKGLISRSWPMVVL